MCGRYAPCSLVDERLLCVFGNDQAVVIVVPLVNNIYFTVFLVAKHVEVVAQHFHLFGCVLNSFQRYRVSLRSDQLAVCESLDIAFIRRVVRSGLGQLFCDCEPQSTSGIFPRFPRIAGLISAG